MRERPDASTEMRELGMFLLTQRARIFPGVGAAILSVRIGFSSTYLGMIERGLKLPSEEAMEVLINELRMQQPDRIRALRLLARARVAFAISADLRRVYDEDVLARYRASPGTVSEQEDPQADLRRTAAEAQRLLQDLQAQLGPPPGPTGRRR